MSGLKKKQKKQPDYFWTGMWLIDVSKVDSTCVSSVVVVSTMETIRIPITAGNSL